MSEQSDDIETRRDRLIKYLLDEVEPEEKFEIERLCNLDADWRAEKKLVQQSLSLFQDAGIDIIGLLTHSNMFSSFSSIDSW